MFDHNMQSWLDEDRMGIDADQASWATGPVFIVVKWVLALAGACAIAVGVIRTAVDYIFITHQTLFIRISTVKQAMRSGGVKERVKSGWDTASQDGVASGAFMTFFALVFPDISTFTSYANDDGTGFSDEGKKKVQIWQWFTTKGLQSICLMVVGFLLASGLVIRLVSLGYRGFTYWAGVGLNQVNPESFLSNTIGGDTATSFDTDTARGYLLDRIAKEAMSAYSGTKAFKYDSKQSLQQRAIIDQQVESGFDSCSPTVQAIQSGSSVQWDPQVYKVSTTVLLKVGNKEAIERTAQTTNNKTYAGTQGNYVDQGAFIIDISPSSGLGLINDSTVADKEFYLLCTWYFKQEVIENNISIGAANTGGGNSGGGSNNSGNSSSSGNLALSLKTGTFTIGNNKVKYKLPQEAISKVEDKLKSELNGINNSVRPAVEWEIGEYQDAYDESKKSGSIELSYTTNNTNSEESEISLTLTYKMQGTKWVYTVS